MNEPNGFTPDISEPNELNDKSHRQESQVHADSLVPSLENALSLSESQRSMLQEVAGRVMMGLMEILCCQAECFAEYAGMAEFLMVDIYISRVYVQSHVL